MVTGPGQMETAAQIRSTHSSPEEANAVQQAQVPSNESSNISVNSEKDCEIVVINTKLSSNPQTAEGKGRKRKRLDFKSDITKTEPKCDRKITDYLKVGYEF
jgi:hypothetical protein